MNILVLFLAYKDLQSREETRNAAWRKRGWDENVYYTGEDVQCDQSSTDPFATAVAGLEASLPLVSFPPPSLLQ